jgi:hypothetical protein
MNGMTVLVSPLNWGFGHAGRMIPVALELKKRGCEVIFAADASMLEMAGRELPGIRLVEIPGLRIRYSRSLPQYICIFLQLPHIIASAFAEHRVLRRLAREMNPSLIISDNRFGFYHRKIYSVYVTHQLRIPFPRLLRLMEPLAACMHRLIINRFDLCLVPDFPGDENLSGRLSHGVRLPRNIMYTGPLSRFGSDDGVAATASASPEGRVISSADATTVSGVSVSDTPSKNTGSLLYPDRDEAAGPSVNPYVSLILSGPEPQRTLLLEKVAEALYGVEPVILSTGPAPHPFMEKHPSATFITAPDKETMHRIIAASSLVLTRAGYTSVMELFSMGRGAVIIPTPGQTEQEYIGMHLNGKYGFITLKQDKLELLPELVAGASGFATAATGSGLSSGERVSGTYSSFVTAGSRPDSRCLETGSDAKSSFAKALFEKAIDCLLEKEKK